MKPRIEILHQAFLTSGICLFLIANPSAAEGVAADRARELRVVGKTVNANLDLFPAGAEPGVVFRQTVGSTGVPAFRLQFTVVENDPAGPSWGIKVLDADGLLVWSIWAAEVERDEFWSDVIPGPLATVVLLSARQDNPVKIGIDRLAVRKVQVVPVSITGANQLASIVGQDDWIVDVGGSVARLRFVGDDGMVYVCTAFLVTSDLMLTNQHCIGTESEMHSALIDFDLDREGSVGKTLRLRQLLQTDFALDYAVVRLQKPIGRLPLPLDSSGVADNEQLVIIQHAGGGPKQVSIADCTVDGVLVKGRGGTDTDFGHQCDTKGGSAGSPVIAFGRRTVVGIHHLGRVPGSDEPKRAVHIDQILADLNPPLRTEIVTGQKGARQ